MALYRAQLSTEAAMRGPRPGPNQAGGVRANLPEQYRAIPSNTSALPNHSNLPALCGEDVVA